MRTRSPVHPLYRAVLRLAVVGLLVCGLRAVPQHSATQHAAVQTSAEPPSPEPADARVPGHIPDYLAAAAAVADEQERERERNTPPTPAAVDPPTPAVARPAPSGACGADVACFLACTRAHESDTAGGYSAVDPSGTYRGAYQFDAATWRASALGAGYSEWADVPVDQVPREVQDAVAAYLYSVSGNSPWGGRC